MEVKIHCKYDELVDPSKLRDHPLNRNKHPKDQIERLLKLYQYNGVRHPIIISNQSGFIVVGHGRKAAALKCGIDKFPVVYQNFESDEQEYSFIQSDNAIALWAELDLGKINEDLGDLGPDFDVDMLGIEDFHLDPADKINVEGTEEFSKEINEKNDYIVLLFKTKEDFEKACNLLKIEKVQTNISPSGHPAFQITGLGRVIDGGELFENL